jgi:hypothetical protein
VIAAGIQVLRPQVEVSTTSLNELEREITRLDPQVVICSRDKPASLPPGLTWAKVPIDPVPQTSNITLGTLLAVIDETEETRSHGGVGAEPATTGRMPFSELPEKG